MDRSLRIIHVTAYANGSLVGGMGYELDPELRERLPQYPDVTVRVEGRNNCGWGQAIPFHAYVEGSDNKKVKWSLARKYGYGTITQKGLYRAPFGKEFHNAAIATSVANPTVSARCEFTVTKEPQ